MASTGPRAAATASLDVLLTDPAASGTRRFIAPGAIAGVAGGVARRPRRVISRASALALTPGSVVLQADVFELIQHKPTTEQVREVPLLFIPPTINKCYILDLAPGRSGAQAPRARQRDPAHAVGKPFKPELLRRAADPWRRSASDRRRYAAALAPVAGAIGRFWSKTL